MEKDECTKALERWLLNAVWNGSHKGNPEKAIITAFKEGWSAALRHNQSKDDL